MKLFYKIIWVIWLFIAWGWVCYSQGYWNAVDEITNARAAQYEEASTPFGRVFTDKVISLKYQTKGKIYER